ncbi:MAG: two-component regulator propeller domain-containing protein [Ignavibacteria bacterium]|nr:two-component regulator propeller domain-containing protein [Ignavibacteria bacterium]
MQKLFLKILTALTIFTFCKVATAQYRSFAFDRLTIEDGLSNNSINCILQTRDGFLWIATKDGLNRYDGQSFKIFKNIPLDSTSLPENYVMSLLESRSGTLWVGTWGGGLCKYNAMYETFTRCDLPTPSDDYIQCLFEDSRNNLWYGTTTGGLNKLNRKTHSIISYNKMPGCKIQFPSDNITFITEDEKGFLWIGTWSDGLIQFNPRAETVKQLTHNPEDINSIASNGVWHILIDDEKFLWLSTFSGVDLLDLTTHEIIHQPNFSVEEKKFLTTTIRQMFKDHFGKLWIGTYDYSGLFYFDKNEKRKRFDNNGFNVLRNEEDNPNSISSNRIRWMYEDRKHNLWVGTEDGLNKLPATKPFLQYRHFPVRNSSLGGKVVSSIYEGHDDILWVGFGGGGFDKIDLKTDVIAHYNHYANDKFSLSDWDVITIHEDKNGIMWVGTSRGGLNRFNPKTGIFTHYLHDAKNPHSIISNWVQQILETYDGLFLVGTNDGLQVFDQEKETFAPYNPVISKNADLLPSKLSVNALYEDREENLWIGTWLDGLFRYSPKEQKLYHYMPDVRDPFSLGSSKVTTIFEDSKGFIWIGTHSGGLNKFDKKTKKFYHFSTHNGLPNDVVFGVLEDRSGNLWVSTLNGLAKFNPSSPVFRVYDAFDGLVHNQFNWRASCKSKSGKMYFGGTNGFVSFFPDSIKVDTTPPPVEFISFRVFDKEAVLPKALSSTKEIVLNNDQNFISIEFAALDLTPNQKHTFEYMLKGIDPGWVNSGSRTTAFYTDLQHGRYTFFVKASNADDVWSKPISLSIIVLPAWWMTWWFRLLVIVAVILIGIFVYEYRINQLLKIERIRYNIASDLHDEIGSNLSSISVDGQMLLRSTSLNNIDRELSFDISKTAMETIDAMRDIIWFINPKNDAGEDIIFKMKETAARLLVGMEWSFNFSHGIRLDHFSLDERRNIFLIYKEVLTNVVRHAEAKKCSVDLIKESNMLDIIIQDNGKGFDVKNVKQNYGLLSIQKRADNISAKLELTSEVGKGTRVLLKVQTKKK